MVRNVFLFIVTMLVMNCLTSCHDSVVPVDAEDDIYGEGLSFIVNETALTYSSLGSDKRVVWQENDMIGIYCHDVEPDALNERAVIHSSFVGQSNGFFRSRLVAATGSINFCAYYPHSEQPGNPALIKHTISPVQNQSGVGNSAQLGENIFMFTPFHQGTIEYAAAVEGGGGLALDFVHTTAILELSFKCSDASAFGRPIKKVSISTKPLDSPPGTLAPPISGEFSFDITKPYSTTGQVNIPDFLQPSDSVALYLENFVMPGNTTDLAKAYLVINPTFFDNFTITYTVENTEYTIEKTIGKALEAHKIYNINIPVEYGVISASPASINLWPAHTQGEIYVESSTPWVIEGTCPVATFSRTSGPAGLTTVVVTRKSSETDFSVFGDSEVKFKTTVGSVKTATVQIHNLQLSAPETLYLPNPVGADTTVYAQDIVTYGGSREFVVESYTPASSWILLMEWDNATLKLKAKIQRNSSIGDRPGTVTVHHKDEPSYKVTIPLLQNEFISVPAFKFFVIDILWCKRPGLDLDIAFMFDGNTPVPPFEHNPVGYGELASDPNLTYRPTNWNSLFSTKIVTYNSLHYGGVIDLLNWGGDATSGEGESVYFDAEAFDGATDVSRYLNLGLYLTWWSHGAAVEPWTVRATLKCYQGGTMERFNSMGTPGNTDVNGVNFRNVGGTLVHQNSFFIDLSHTMAHSPSTFTTSFTYAAKIKYDRLTHYGSMNETVPQTPKWSEDRPLCSNGSDVYSSSLTPDELKRISTAAEAAKKKIFK
ncbi:MAG: fimbrillin family protein [Tannerella sp.]|jgi:hypothetical protein|nr:fimbrillin family protein [Tannerella sp.]